MLELAGKVRDGASRRLEKIYNETRRNATPPAYNGGGLAGPAKQVESRGGGLTLEKGGRLCLDYIFVL